MGYLNQVSHSSEASVQMGQRDHASPQGSGGGGKETTPTSIPVLSSPKVAVESKNHEPSSKKSTGIQEDTSTTALFSSGLKSSSHARPVSQSNGPKECSGPSKPELGPESGRLANFPNKLFTLLAFAKKREDTSGTKQQISWSEDGESFFFLDPDAFMNDLGRMFFPKQSCFRALERQLNSWGWKRHCKLGRMCFTHPYFHRDHPELKRHIIRRSQALARDGRSSSQAPSKRNLTPECWPGPSAKEALHCTEKRNTQDYSEGAKSPRVLRVSKSIPAWALMEQQKVLKYFDKKTTVEGKAHTPPDTMAIQGATSTPLPAGRSHELTKNEGGVANDVDSARELYKRRRINRDFRLFCAGMQAQRCKDYVQWGCDEAESCIDIDEVPAFPLSPRGMGHGKMI